MAEVTLKEIHEEDNLELSEDIKKQIAISRKTPISQMIPQNEVEMEFQGFQKPC